MAAVLTVDQQLVDNYLARANRFSENVKRFEEQLKEITNAIKGRFVPDTDQTAMPAYQAAVATESEQAVVTADDIDIDALLNGVDLNEMSM